MEFYALEPWGFPIADLHVGILATTVAATVGAKKKPQDFMVGKYEEQEEDIVETIKELLNAVEVPPNPKG